MKRKDKPNRQQKSKQDSLNGKVNKRKNKTSGQQKSKHRSGKPRKNSGRSKRHVKTEQT